MFEVERIRCSDKTGLSVRPLPDLVFEVERILQRRSAFMHLTCIYSGKRSLLCEPYGNRLKQHKNLHKRWRNQTGRYTELAQCINKNFALTYLSGTLKSFRFRGPPCSCFSICIDQRGRGSLTEGWTSQIYKYGLTKTCQFDENIFGDYIKDRKQPRGLYRGDDQRQEGKERNRTPLASCTGN